MMTLGGVRNKRGRKYWESRHPGEGRLIADIARDHPDWDDEDVVAQLRFEQLGPDAR